METATAYQKSIIGEEDRIQQMNRMVDHVLLGGEIHYAYTDLIANYAGPPARWWPHPKLNKNLGATKIYEALDGFVGEEPVTYRIVPMKVVRYAVADDMGLIGGTTQLISTDELLGHPRGNYGNTRRGIEPARPDDQPDSGRDKVTLSNDRRTLSLDLSASSAVDQIRVIVLEQPQIATPSRINFNNTFRSETTLSDL